MLVGLWAASGAVAEEHGRIREQEGLRILELWGTDAERGAAQGRLLGAEIVKVLDLLITHGIEGNRVAYEQVLMPFTRRTQMHARQLAELHGIVAGMKERFGELPTVPALGRAIAFEDLYALNCIPDLAPVACSTFTAWGRMTAGGQTLTGRNLDWLAVPGLADEQIVVARAADKESLRAGWVSVTVPGFIGCLTGMSHHGVTVALHDVLAGKPAVDTGLIPRAMAARDAIEAALPYSEPRDIEGILRARPSAVGNLVVVSFPVRPRSTGTPGVVFEYDGHSPFADRVTLGVIKGHDFVAGTNHYRVKATETPSCARFDYLYAELSGLESSGEKLTVEKTWSLLEAVAQPREGSPRLLTYHSVVFEPGAMTMHVGLARGAAAAGKGRKVTVDAGALLKEAGGR